MTLDDQFYLIAYCTAIGWQAYRELANPAESTPLAEPVR